MEIKLTTKYYIIFAVEGLIIAIMLVCLIMTKFNKISIKEMFNKKSKIIIFVAVVIIITIILTIVSGIITNKVFLKVEMPEMTNEMQKGERNMEFDSNKENKDVVNEDSNTTENTI